MTRLAWVAWEWQQSQERKLQNSSLWHLRSPPPCRRQFLQLCLSSSQERTLCFNLSYLFSPEGILHIVFQMSPVFMSCHRVHSCGPRIYFTERATCFLQVTWWDCHNHVAFLSQLWWDAALIREKLVEGLFRWWGGSGRRLGMFFRVHHIYGKASNSRVSRIHDVIKWILKILSHYSFPLLSNLD